MFLGLVELEAYSLFLERHLSAAEIFRVCAWRPFYRTDHPNSLAIVPLIVRTVKIP